MKLRKGLWPVCLVAAGASLPAYAVDIAPTVGQAPVATPAATTSTTPAKLGATCSASVQGLLKLLEHISSGNRVAISKSTTADGKPWKCTPDPDSPTFLAKGDCSESWVRMMSNGGAVHLNHKDIKSDPLGVADRARLAVENGNPEDSVKKALSDVWYAWNEKTDETDKSHHFVGRFCTRVKDDYLPAAAFLKNSASMKDDGKTVSAAGKLSSHSTETLAKIYQSSELRNAIALMATLKDGSCIPTLNSTTYFVSSRAKADQYTGGKPLGGRFNINANLIYDEDSKVFDNSETSAVFTSGWVRSILTDNFNHDISMGMQGWLRHTIGATPAINWKNWDVRRKAVVRFTWAPDFSSYTFDTLRFYQVMRLHKVPFDLKPGANNFDTNTWISVGTYPHNHFKTYVYDKDANRYDDDNTENDRIKGQISRISDFADKCPWAMTTVDATITNLKRYAEEEKSPEGSHFPVPGTRFGEAKKK